MKTEKEIKKRIKVLIQRHMAKYFRQNLKICPENCKHYKLCEGKNDVFELTNEYGKRKIEVKDASVGVCGKDLNEMHICHLEEDAQACFNGIYKDRTFTPKFSKKELSDMFYEVLDNKVKLKEEFPDLYNLEWILIDSENKLSWWSRLKLWVKKLIFLTK